MVEKSRSNHFDWTRIARASRSNHFDCKQMVRTSRSKHLTANELGEAAEAALAAGAEDPTPRWGCPTRSARERSTHLNYSTFQRIKLRWLSRIFSIENKLEHSCDVKYCKHLLTLSEIVHRFGPVPAYGSNYAPKIPNKFQKIVRTRIVHISETFVQKMSKHLKNDL